MKDVGRTWTGREVERGRDERQEQRNGRRKRANGRKYSQEDDWHIDGMVDEEGLEVRRKEVGKEWHNW